MRAEDVPDTAGLIRLLTIERDDETRILHEQALEQRLQAVLRQTLHPDNASRFRQAIVQHALLVEQGDRDIRKLILASRLLNKLSDKADGGDHYLWTKQAILHPHPLKFFLAYPLAQELLSFAERRQETAGFFLGLLNNTVLPSDIYQVADMALSDPLMFRSHQPGDALSLKIFAAYLGELRSPRAAVRDGASSELYDFCARIVHWPQAFTLTRRARRAIREA